MNKACSRGGKCEDGQGQTSCALHECMHACCVCFMTASWLEAPLVGLANTGSPFMRSYSCTLRVALPSGPTMMVTLSFATSSSDLDRLTMQGPAALPTLNISVMTPVLACTRTYLPQQQQHIRPQQEVQGWRAVFKRVWCLLSDIYRLFCPLSKHQDKGAPGLVMVASLPMPLNTALGLTLTPA